MNGFGFASLSWAFLFLLAIPVVVFYFLKLKRPRLEIPSLVLWQQVVRDARVNSPFQRFKRNLLLLLQLLLLFLLCLAALQPYWRGAEARAERIPILLDCSASMGAQSREGGETRFSMAKARIRETIENLLPDQRLCLIAFADRARRLTGFTNNRRTLLDALEAAPLRETGSDLEEALRLTEALSRNTAFADAVLYTDGNLPAHLSLNLSYAINLQLMPAAGPNLGIVRLNARRDTEGIWSVFLAIAGPSGARAAVELIHERPGGAITLQTSHILIGEDGADHLAFRLGWEQEAALTVKLTPSGPDSLGCDNTARLFLPAARNLRVACPAGLTVANNALAAHDLAQPIPPAACTAEEPADLLLTDRQEDLDRPARVLLSFGLVPPEAREFLHLEQKGGDLIDWRRDHPLLQHVELREVLLLDRPTAGAAVREADFENLGFHILIHGRHGPLLLEQRGDERDAYYLLFHPNRSTLPYRVAFPILIANALDLAQDAAGLNQATGLTTGVLPPWTGLPNTDYTLASPDGTSRTVRSAPNGLLAGLAAPQTGWYTLAGPDGTSPRFGVNLLSPRETSLAAVDALRFRELTVEAAAAPVAPDRPLWEVLALLGFAVLLFEWWVFTRPPAYRRPAAGQPETIRVRP